MNFRTMKAFVDIGNVGAILIQGIWIKNNMNKILFRKIINFLLLLVIVLFVVSGFVMTNPKFLDFFGMGVFRRGDFFSLHSGLVVPLIILVIIHVYPYMRIRK